MEFVKYSAVFPPLTANRPAWHSAVFPSVIALLQTHTSLLAANHIWLAYFLYSKELPPTKVSKQQNDSPYTWDVNLMMMMTIAMMAVSLQTKIQDGGSPHLCQAHWWLKKPTWDRQVLPVAEGVVLKSDGCWRVSSSTSYSSPLRWPFGFPWRWTGGQCVTWSLDQQTALPFDSGRCCRWWGTFTKSVWISFMLPLSHKNIVF